MFLSTTEKETLEMLHVLKQNTLTPPVKRTSLIWKEFGRMFPKH